MMRGSCLCGAVVFKVSPPLRGILTCHCTQCRMTSGHYAASFDVEEDALIWSDRLVQEYATAGGAQRGFCPCCGSSRVSTIGSATPGFAGMSCFSFYSEQFGPIIPLDRAKSISLCLLSCQASEWNQTVSAKQADFRNIHIMLKSNSSSRPRQGRNSELRCAMKAIMIAQL